MQRTRTCRAAVAVTAMVATLVLGGVQVLATVGHLDPEGDVEGGPGPDITRVDIDTRAAELGITVTFATEPPLALSEAEGWTDMLLVSIDTGERATSDVDADAIVGVHGAGLAEGATLAMRDGNGDWRTQDDRLPVAVAGPTVTVTIPLDRLGDPGRVAIIVGAGREMNDGSAAGGDHYPQRGWQDVALAGGGGWAGVPAAVVAVGATLAALAAVGLALALLSGNWRGPRIAHLPR